jgi:hypothetical protein
MFVYKKEEELAKMTPEERDTYAADKRKHEEGLQEKAIQKALEALKEDLTKDQKKAIQDEIKALNLNEGITKAQFDEVLETINQLKENPSLAKETNDFWGEIEKSLKAALPKIKEKASGAGETPWDYDIEIKAAIPMGNATTVTNGGGQTIPIAYVSQGISDYAPDVRNREFILQYLDNGNTDKAALAYMDKLPTQGTMAVTAEGALKPLISITFALRYSQPQKIAGRTKISEENLDDVPYILSIIRNELMYQHDIAEQTAVFTKVAAIAPAFVAGSLAASTTNPSNYDAVRAAIYAIKIASKGMYVPNAALVDSADVYAMGATKDANNNYVFPPFVLPDGSKVSGVQIIETQNTDVVPAGTFIVGDWKKLHRRIYKAFTVRIGQGINTGLDGQATVQSDFESNMYTLIGESREHLWIYENEKVAFIKTTFAAVKTAIAAS